MRTIIYPENGKPTEYGYIVSMNTEAGYNQYCVEDFKSAALPRVHTPLVICVGNSLSSACKMIDILTKIDESMPAEWKRYYTLLVAAGWEKYNKLLRGTANG